MATSSISASFDLTEKSSAKNFVKALSAAYGSKSKCQENVTLLTKREALSILKKKNKIRKGKKKMTDNENPYEKDYLALADRYNQLIEHLLGPDWHSEYWNHEDIYEDALQDILRTYRGVKENKILRWRRRHKKCCYCHNLHYLNNPTGQGCYICEAKDKMIRCPEMHRLCSLFELNSDNFNKRR